VRWETGVPSIAKRGAGFGLKPGRLAFDFRKAGPVLFFFGGEIKKQ